MIFSRSRIKNIIVNVAVVFFLTVLIVPSANLFDSDVWWSFNEEEFWSEMNECTTGLASGLATPDGKPLLWKNRDLGGGSNQEFHYVSDGRIPFIGMTYANRLDEYYGGINAVGFAVENSNSYNLDFDVAAGLDDDGEIMYLALAICRTVDDFERILDSTNIEGRTLNCNYGAFDAFGGAAMFETSAHAYDRIDAAESVDGFVVRANHSFVSGRDLDNRDAYWGPHRYDTGYDLFKEAVENGGITPRDIFQKVTRNISIAGMDDYAVPYENYWSGYPYGCIPNGEAICRQSTRSVMLAQGVRPHEPPEDGILWVMGGSQISSIAIPLWVRAGSVPEEVDGPNRGRICDRAIELRDWIYLDGGGGVNTFKLVNAAGTGLWDYMFPIEDWVLAKTDQFLNSPRFSYDRIEAFQNEIAQQVADSLENWNPTFNVTDISEPVFWENRLELRWGEIGGDEGLMGGREPRGYAVYRSDQPFRNGVMGQRLALVEDTRYTDSNPLPGAAFYRIEAIW